MTSPISAIGAISSISPTPAAGGVDGTPVAGGASPTGTDFASVLGKGMDSVAGAQHNADSLAIQAATGQSVDPAALTIAMTQAQLMTQLMTTVQNKAVMSFNTIMGMQA
jgi:flagellar hook-basal body complex protein FliE